MAIAPLDDEGRPSAGRFARRAAWAIWWVISRCGATACLIGYLVWAIVFR